MKSLLLLLSTLLLSFPLQAQPAINGYVYEMQTGEALEGTRVQLKDRAGLEIGTLQPIYTDAAGYFEFPNLKPKDYRIEVIHVFETAEGPIGVRLFTNTDVLAVDSNEVAITIGMSRWTADHFKEKMERSRPIQAHMSAQGDQKGPVKIDVPDSIWKDYQIQQKRDYLMGSRILVHYRKDLQFVEYAEPVRTAY